MIECSKRSLLGTFIIISTVNLLLSEWLWQSSSVQRISYKKQGKGGCFSSFSYVKNQTNDHCFCRMSSWYGQLGNRIAAVSKMIGQARNISCGIEIPHDMVQNWTPITRKWSFVSKTNVTKSTCGSRTGEEWFRNNTNHRASTCDLQPLRDYFRINKTHAFGKKCPAAGHVALHVRSGDK